MAVLLAGLDAQAVVFDFNGTITDDERLQADIYREIARELGTELTEEQYFAELAGLSEPEIAAWVLAKAGRDAGEAGRVVEKRLAAYRRAAGSTSPVRPGSAALVRALHGRVPMAVVSGAMRSEIDFVLSAAGLAECFEFVVSAEDVVAGKPDPEGFEVAFRRLTGLVVGLTRDRVVVLEDSRAGLVAARAAGLRCVIAHAAQPEAVSDADAVVESLHAGLLDDGVHPLAEQVFSDRVERIVPVELGITNRNYRVFVRGGGSYMLRIPGELTEVLGIDRANEAEAALRAAQLGIGPPVLSRLESAGTLVTEFVGGSHAVDAADFVSRLPSVVATLRLFHQSGHLSGRFPIHRVVEWHARDAARHGVSAPDVYGWLNARSQAIEEAFAVNPLPEVPCHNDLLPANLLFDGDRVWLLDYEYAGMNDRFFDLGNLSVNSGLDASADELLLTSYFGSVTKAAMARLALMKIMSEFREGMWGVVQQAISTLTNVDFVAYANERLENCRRLATAPEFDAWLEEAKGVVA